MTTGNAQRSSLPVVSYPTIETERTVLRAFALTDAPFFARLNGDPVARKFFYPGSLDAAAARGALNWIVDHWRAHGFGFYAVRVKSDGTLIGGTGLSVMSGGNGASPLKVEIGWIFAPSCWGQGLATEAARAALGDAWSRAGIDEVIAYMTRSNVRSRRLAERLGMSSASKDDFEDETVPSGHWQRPHVLYRIQRPAQAWG